MKSSNRAQWHNWVPLAVCQAMLLKANVLLGVELPLKGDRLPSSRWVNYCLNTIQNVGLEIIILIFLTISFCQESRAAQLTSIQAPSQEPNQDISQGLGWSYLKLPVSGLTSVTFCRLQFPADCWTDSLDSSLLAHQRKSRLQIVLACPQQPI